jgi:S-adenosylmethionine-dependent methyltransferase
LAKQDHEVTLSDLSEKSLDIARKNADAAGVRLEAIIHANALSIAQDPNLQASHGAFDVVLCLGPLYHLLDPEERAQAISNSIAMAKPGGYILMAYVTVFAHLRDMARRDPSRLAAEWDFYQKYLDSGRYTRNSHNESFHLYPAELERDLGAFSHQVKVEKTVSCEGFLGAGGAQELAGLGDSEMERWVDVVMRSADQRETIHSADHLLVVVRKL